MGVVADTVLAHQGRQVIGIIPSIFTETGKLHILFDQDRGC